MKLSRRIINGHLSATAGDRRGDRPSTYAFDLSGGATSIQTIAPPAG